MTEPDHRLIVIRHAKTEQGAVDRTRRLTDRGRRDAAAVGKWLAEHRVVPDLVVVSPATRARETWDLAAAELDDDPAVTVDDDIYANSAEDLIDVIRKAKAAVGTLALVGHNPSIAELAARWGGEGDVPTGTVLVFDVTGDWTDIGTATSRLTELATCRG